MATPQTRRHVNQLLRMIHEAMAVSDWRTVGRVSNDLLAIVPDHADALAALEIAARSMASEAAEPPHTRRLWTAEEEATLRELAGTRPTREIARLLDRTPDSVRHRAYSLGLSLRYRRSSDNDTGRAEASWFPQTS